ncbi:MAG TPA: OB-fold domain-containing protein [Microthrixaceae bacterium]|nr:OB-fold domain-containing protein [Microthrixaceae bacterium]
MADSRPTGLTAWGVYLPTWRLDRKAIAATLGGPAGRGTRTVASHDEDTTTMGAEAARQAVALLDSLPQDLYFATPDPAYLDKTNATAIHAAVGLEDDAGSYDLAGSSRSGVAAVRTAAATARRGHPTMAVMSDLRSGLAGSADERDGGDGAVALVFGEDPVAEIVSVGSATTEFLDRWRTPGDAESKQWEERFGQEVYGPLATAALERALAAAEISIDAVDHVIVSGLHVRATKEAVRASGATTEAVVADRLDTTGNLGAAHPWLLLADVLEQARPHQTIVVLLLADGADAMVLRTTERLTEVQQRRADAGIGSVDDLIASTREVDYPRYLTWRGQLRREPPRRPDPERPGAPATWRSSGWRGGFEASRCRKCGFRHLPPTRVCLSCRAVDEMDPERLADVRGRIATFTVDRLAFSLSPPVIGVVVDFDEGGRYRCELTDADPGELAIGQQVEMAYRRVSTAQGVHNYFWKAKPTRGGPT